MSTPNIYKRLTDRQRILQKNNKEFIQDLDRAHSVFIYAHASEISLKVTKKNVLQWARHHTIQYDVTLLPHPEMNIY